MRRPSVEAEIWASCLGVLTVLAIKVAILVLIIMALVKYVGC